MDADSLSVMSERTDGRRGRPSASAFTQRRYLIYSTVYDRNARLWLTQAGWSCGWESLMKSVTLGNVTMSHRTRERPAECLASLSHSTMIGLPRAQH
ncbi:hypothetical protein EVAR_39941_1 [Eumeta japonica]|uniref:Uncharacterized protein n=1 Tax=Eumeta variegata TaxID=151549 RepID=A0A4C1X2U4_EUMVA|nr:hypothetical protein EVAR_39941_1 [Eumeta japonica]